MLSGLLRVLVIGLVLLVAAMMLLPRRDGLPSAELTATLIDPPRELPAVTLIDHNGDPFVISQLAGRPAFVFFGFTNCPDICPLTLAVLADVSRRLRGQAPDFAPAVLFVSVDPGRDTPERIRTYVNAFDPAFIGATADEATLAPLIALLGVTVHQQQQGDETYNVVHNGTVYVLDAAGRWRAIFGGSSHQATTLVADTLAMRARLGAE